MANVSGLVRVVLLPVQVALVNVLGHHEHF